MSAFETIAPVTFYYENSPYAEAITEKIRQKYLNDKDESALKNGILEVSFFNILFLPQKIFYHLCLSGSIIWRIIFPNLAVFFSKCLALLL